MSREYGKLTIDFEENYPVLICDVPLKGSIDDVEVVPLLYSVEFGVLGAMLFVFRRAGEPRTMFLSTLTSENFSKVMSGMIAKGSIFVVVEDRVFKKEVSEKLKQVCGKFLRIVKKEPVPNDKYEEAVKTLARSGELKRLEKVVRTRHVCSVPSSLKIQGELVRFEIEGVSIEKVPEELGVSEGIAKTPWGYVAALFFHLPLGDTFINIMVCPNDGLGVLKKIAETGYYEVRLKGTEGWIVLKVVLTEEKIKAVREQIRMLKERGVECVNFDKAKDYVSRVFSAGHVPEIQMVKPIKPS